MSRYSLSEEYSQIYSKKFDTNLYNNLRFVDYMMDEDIEYVMESLYWEFRDYGSSCDESFEILESTLTEDSLNESLEYICEMNPYAPAGSKEAQAYNKYTSKSKKSAEQKQKWDARRARITGAVRRVKGDIKSGVKNLATSAQNKISSARKGAMAQLSRVMRGAKNFGLNVANRAMNAASRVESGARRVGSAARAGASAFKSELSKDRSRPEYIPPKDFADRDKQYAKFKRRDAATSKLAKAAVGTIGLDRRYAVPGGQFAQSPRAAAAYMRAQKAAAGRTSRGTRFAAPGGVLSPQRSSTGRREAAGKFAKKIGLSDNFEYLLNIIANDMVNEGYADNFEDALIIFENLSDYIIESTINEYANYYLAE